MRVSGLITGLLALGIVGCGPSNVSLSMRVGTPRAASASQPLRQALQFDNGIAIDRIRITVRELELEQAGADEDSGGDADGTEVEKGPYLIDLSGQDLEGGVVKLLAAEVPAGTYGEIEFKIARVNHDETSAPEFADLIAAEASIIVDGTIDGAPFTFTTGLDEHQEYEGNLVVGEGQDNITLNIDPSGWFTGQNGTRLDPRVSDFRSGIEANIKTSIDVFEDDDADGSHDAED